MNVLAYDLYPNDPGRAIVEYVTLDELYPRADVITLHCNLTPENTGMINKDSIAKMKDGVILINNARGQRIDEQDVADALNCGKMAAAGLDVVYTEPIRADNPLLKAKNYIIAPLGTVAIAANSFAVTAEALCYMPGYGVQSAAVTLIGQSVGAKRKDLVTRLGWVTVLLGMGVMLVASALMYALAPWIIGMLSPDRQVVLLGTQVLRIVVFSEPLFGASIVTAGVFQGAGSSLLSSVLNFVSMWGVRITLTLLLVPHWGLRGAWIAMCIELCFRGSLFLFFLWRKRWLPRELV